MRIVRFATLKLARSSSHENDVYFITKSGVNFFSQKAQS